MKVERLRGLLEIRALLFKKRQRIGSNSIFANIHIWQLSQMLGLWMFDAKPNSTFNIISLHYAIITLFLCIFDRLNTTLKKKRETLEPEMDTCLYELTYLLQCFEQLLKEAEKIRKEMSGWYE